MLRRQGFTLIELLVVIAIIAILAAILFPVFAQAREKARMTVCTSNLKQLSMAFLMYAQDNEERFPIATWSYGPASTVNWPFATLPYIKNKTIWICTIDQFRDRIPANDTAPGSFHVSYAGNMWLWGYTVVNGNWIQPAIRYYTPGVKLGEVRAPSATVLLSCQATQDAIHNCSAGWPPGFALLPGTQWKFCSHLGHKQQAVSFCDGHVKGVNFWLDSAKADPANPALYTGNGMTMDPSVAP